MITVPNHRAELSLLDHCLVLGQRPRSSLFLPHAAGIAQTTSQALPGLLWQAAAVHAVLQQVAYRLHFLVSRRRLHISITNFGGKRGFPSVFQHQYPEHNQQS